MVPRTSGIVPLVGERSRARGAGARTRGRDRSVHRVQICSTEEVAVVRPRDGDGPAEAAQMLVSAFSHHGPVAIDERTQTL